MTSKIPVPALRPTPSILDDPPRVKPTAFRTVAPATFRPEPVKVAPVTIDRAAVEAWLRARPDEALDILVGLSTSNAEPVIKTVDEAKKAARRAQSRELMRAKRARDKAVKL